MENIPINFKIYHKDSAGKPVFIKEASFNQATIKVGRGDAADLKLEDETVGMMHAYIQVQNGKVVITEVISQRGTFVNNKKINKSELHSGDEILLGDSLLVAFFDEKSEEAPALAGGQGAGGGSPMFQAAPGTMAMSGAPVDLSKIEDPSKKQAISVVTYYEGSPMQSDLLSDHKEGEKPGVLPMIAMIIGGLFMVAGLFFGYMSVKTVKEEQKVNAIIKEIAKDRGLSDKFVPKVRGNAVYDFGFILFSLFGATVFVGGLARIYYRKRILANFTIGEDPTSVFVCSSKELPVPKFPLVKSDRSEGYHLLFTDKMEGSVTDPSGSKYMLTELVQQGRAVSGEYNGTYDFAIPDNYSALVGFGPYRWQISSVNQPKLLMPFRVPKNMFMGMVVTWVLIVGMMAWYFNHLQEDEMFSDTTEQQEVKVRTIIKSANLQAKKQKKIKQQKLKDKKKDKNIYKAVKSKVKDKAAAPRDARNTSKGSGQGGAGAGMSRISGPQGMGVANVLSSQISAMTASLTASNTAFGQETEDLDDMLGDADPDGEAMDGGFGGRGGSGGGGAGGGLGIGGGGGTGWGGIGIGGGGGLGGKIGGIGGIHRRGISIRQGRAEVSGKLDPAEVRAVIRAHRREVQHCYQKGLMQNDKIQGTVRVSFLINTAGRVNSCSVTENLAVPLVGTCICSRLRTWKFPQPQGGLARVAYAWTLTPGQ